MSISTLAGRRESVVSEHKRALEAPHREGGPLMGKLEGKVALVSGAAQGIGRAVAELFAEEGALVYAGDIKDVASGKGIEPVNARCDEARRLEKGGRRHRREARPDRRARQQRWNRARLWAGGGHRARRLQRRGLGQPHGHLPRHEGRPGADAQGRQGVDRQLLLDLGQCWRRRRGRVQRRQGGRPQSHQERSDQLCRPKTSG